MGLLNLLLCCVSLQLLLVSAGNSVSIIHITVKSDGINSPKCLTSNETACQSLDYVFENLKSIETFTVIVSIASPQTVTVSSTEQSEFTRELTLMGVNEASSSKSNKVLIDFNSMHFNFPDISITFQRFDIVNARSLIFNANVNKIWFNDCLLISIDSLTIKPTTGTDLQTSLTLQSSLIRDNKFGPNSFIYYIPPRPLFPGDYPPYALNIYLYDSNFTENIGDILTTENKETGTIYLGDIVVNNCIFSGNTNPGFNLTTDIDTRSGYFLYFSIINTTFSHNNHLNIMVGLTGGNNLSSLVEFKLAGLTFSNNYDSFLMTGDSLFNSTVQLNDSIFSNNDGLLFSAKSPNKCSLQASNVLFQGNKRFFIDVVPEQLPLTSITVKNSTIIP